MRIGCAASQHSRSSFHSHYYLVRIPDGEMTMSDIQADVIQDRSEPSWITRGHPSYVWRFGQERRLSLIQQVATLTGQRILDAGCGVGSYVRAFRRFSPHVFGFDLD